MLITGKYSFHTELWLELEELFTKLGFHCGCLWEVWIAFTSALFNFEFCDTGGICVIIRVLPITYYVQTKIMPHLKHVEYFVSVTTHVNLNREHILLPGKVEGSCLMIAWKAITMYIFSVINNDHNNAHA